MRTSRFNTIISLIGGLLMVIATVVAQADDNPNRRQRDQKSRQAAPQTAPSQSQAESATVAGAVESEAKPRALRFNLATTATVANRGLAAVGQPEKRSLIVQAQEIVEPESREMNPDDDVTIELRDAVQVGFQDGSMRVWADYGEIVIKYKDQARTTIESLTFNLSGKVRWKSDGIYAWADTLAICFRPAAPANGSGVQSPAWIVRGQAKVKGKNFIAKADSVELKSVCEDQRSPESTIHVVLDGNATLKFTNGGGEWHGRIEISPTHGEAVNPASFFEALLKGQP